MLLSTLASFIGVKISGPPPQHISPITGFPTWHETYKNETREVTMSFIMLALLFATGASYAARRATRAPSRSLTGFVTLATGNEESSTQINNFIQYYIDATWIAVLGYLFFDVGKIWAVVGALHNLLEVALLIVLQSGGRVSSMSFGLYMFLYVCVTILLSVYLPWPFDAIFFRWQGLCSDFGLIIMFTRMYYSTKKQLNAFGDPDRHDKELAKAQKAADDMAREHEQQQHSSIMASSSSLHGVNLETRASQGTSATANGTVSNANGHGSLHQHLHSHWKKFVALAPNPHQRDSSASSNGHQPSSSHASLTPATPVQEPRFGGEPAHVIDFVPASSSNSNSANGHPTGRVSVVALNQNTSIWGVQWHNPDQLLLLVAASYFHVIGNCVTTIWITNLYAMAAFHLSYGISYPLYAYYLYVDNHALRQTKVYLPDFKKIKTFAVACWALVGATLTVRAGLLVSTLNKHNDSGNIF
ncbi:hypothetical protein EDD11_005630 [Mortierella claussenii]|nr:hypothetical protein EDD11_005630 [Mortierella claussenii]